MNRGELQQLAEDRAEDAQILLAAGRWSGAYYLAGYAVECGLKACVLVHIERTGVIFEDKKYAERCWTHDLEDLVTLAGLQQSMAVDGTTNANLADNWQVAKDWNELSRYQQVPEDGGPCVI
jgi:HEPN domain-containing protein